MANLIKKIKWFYQYFRGFFPSLLPVGKQEFEAWIQSFLDTYDLPTKNLDSIKFTLTTMVIHLGPQDDRRSKYFFFKSIRAAAAKQLCGAEFHDLKLRQRAAQEEAAKQAEATALKANESVQSVQQQTV